MSGRDQQRVVIVVSYAVFGFYSKHGKPRERERLRERERERERKRDRERERERPIQNNLKQ